MRSFPQRHAMVSLVVTCGLLLGPGGTALAMAGADTPPAPPWEVRTSQAHPLVGKVFVPRSGGFLTPTEAIERMAGADFVLLGEKHDNPDHHRLQAWVTGRLVERGRRPALVLEMIDTDHGDAVAAYLRDYPREAAGLGDAVGWSRTGWPEWSQYRPIVEAVVSAGLPVVPGNLPRDLVRRIGREGLAALDVETVRRLGVDREPTAAAASGLAREIVENHCRMLPDAAIPRMVQVQRSRDGSLAATMKAAGDKGGAVLIAGAGHARTDWGVPDYLRDSGDGRSIVSVAFIEVDDDHADAWTYADRFGVATLPFDLVWFTPRVDNEDPCAKMVEHMHRKKEKGEKGGK
ncbi:MAG: ChaN family lipoprotein [Alphaproteobacteria bacterium]